MNLSTYESIYPPPYHLAEQISPVFPSVSAVRFRPDGERPLLENGHMSRCGQREELNQQAQDHHNSLQVCGNPVRISFRRPLTIITYNTSIHTISQHATNSQSNGHNYKSDTVAYSRLLLTTAHSYSSWLHTFKIYHHINLTNHALIAHQRAMLSPSSVRHVVHIRC